MIVTILVIVFVAIATNADAKSKSEIVNTISASAKVADIDPDLAVAIATVESGLNPKAIGSLGEVGLFQLRPEYHSVVQGNVTQNILAGVAFLAYVKSVCGTKYGNAWFVAHNYGPSCRLKHPTKTDYYKRVMRALGDIKSKRYLAGN